ncbi:MAG: glycosyltransferase [Planctomycetales bacterium]|nr:glycosyltransferase [Planctomycetales bacterium]NIM08394.1 glycosyltransferase [Planctomycetales bacterium]NIN07869.1 glycosyltransferase [Planctomycetales bacterium]NIN76999.1 glycosyltransferase [Planctomycetales bacterium]NIO34182.1 glycosyltransferase [Planctomycetales bacterium]
METTDQIKNEQQHSQTGPQAVPAPVDTACVERIEATIERADQLLDKAQQQETTCAVSVVLPVYNERETLQQVVQRVLRLPIHKEVLIVDDGSTDGTSKIADQLAEIPEVQVIHHATNRGKGAALRTALGITRGDVVIIQDADLEYDPADIVMLTQPILANRCDVVYGSRYLAPVQRDGWLHRSGNRLLTALSNLFTGQQLTDMETCYKAIRRSVLLNLPLQQNRFGIEPELTAKLSWRGKKIYEMPISYKSRGYAEGKKIGLRDALETLWCIIRYGMINT